MYLEQSYTPRNETVEFVAEVVRKTADSVVSTMGPNGNLALIIETNLPVVTKDGVRVAKAMDFDDIRKTSIARVITDAATKTDEMVGDGTTTTILIVDKLYNKYGSNLNFHATKMVDSLVSEAKEVLESKVMQITPEDEKFKRMLYTTSNYQSEIADTIIDIYKRFNNPNLLLKRSRGNVKDLIEENRSVVFDGRYPHGVLKPNTMRNEIILDKAICIVVNNYVRFISQDINVKLINLMMETNLPIFIFARDFEGPALDALTQVNQYLDKNMPRHIDDHVRIPRVIPYNINGGGSSGAEIVNDFSRIIDISSLNDISVINNITTEEAISNYTLKGDIRIDLAGIYIDPHQSIGEDKTYSDNINSILTTALPIYQGMNYSEKAAPIGQILFNRISRLRGENVTIYVSGLTDAEVSERFYLYEDAARVAASSLRFGVIYGIGWGYIQVAEYLYEKYSHLQEASGKREQIQWMIIKDFIDVMSAQYEHLTDQTYVPGEKVLYRDLVTFEELEIPDTVFDNGSAAIVALEGGWSVVKRLGKLSCILGKSNTSYA